MASLSVVISVYNEEVKITDCLESVKWADEIVLVDSSSTDNTPQIAKKYTEKIFTRPNNPMLNVNKNFGFTKATSDWILCLDADERVTPELCEEIKEVIYGHGGDFSTRPSTSSGLAQNDKDVVNGYWIPRKNIIFGKWIEYTGWYPDHQMRLFKRGKGRFPEAHVHEMVEVEGETDYLKEHILHYNYDTISQFLDKLNRIYAPNESSELLRKGYEFNWLDAVRFPFNEFLSRFFAREGYKDGFHGLMLSLLMAFYHLIVFAKVWEQRQFKDSEDEDVVFRLQKETNVGFKNLHHWFGKIKVAKTKNPAKKIFYKALAKVRR